jgi:hypothetical protein
MTLIPDKQKDHEFKEDQGKVSKILSQKQKVKEKKKKETEEEEKNKEKQYKTKQLECRLRGGMLASQVGGPGFYFQYLRVWGGAG